jgi:glyoxylase-like metal-dependent hydrolase (beta-lactamase superfamily II)
MHPLLLPAMNPGPTTGEGTCTWLIPHDRAVLVDAGVGDSRHVDALGRALRETNATLNLMVITHAHTDHMGGVSAVRAAWPGARVMKFPWPELDAPYQVQIEPLHDLQLIRAAGEELVVLHTPGHSPDHVCLWHERSRSLFGGDLLIEGGTVVIPASRGGRLSAYLGSLERLLVLGPARVFPGHGPIIERPDDLIRRTLAHRRHREEQLLDALSRGAGTPASLAAMIYDRLPDRVQRLAEESVLAHLVKLREDGRVTYDGHSYRLTP